MADLNLLDKALGLDVGQKKNWGSGRGQVVVVEDCVETSGMFLVHYLISRSLSSSSSFVILLALSRPFSHYQRILRKLGVGGCNFSLQRENNRFFFIDANHMCLQSHSSSDGDDGGLVSLYAKIHNLVVEAATSANVSSQERNSCSIIIDDLSLLEVAACGSFTHVRQFLHYFHTLTLEYGCSLVLLGHEDIYSTLEGRPALNLHVKYISDILIRVQPLATGLASDVHGQLTVLNKGTCSNPGISRNEMSTFHFRVKENMVVYFYQGIQS